MAAYPAPAATLQSRARSVPINPSVESDSSSPAMPGRRMQCIDSKDFSPIWQLFLPRALIVAVGVASQAPSVSGNGATMIEPALVRAQTVMSANTYVALATNDQE